MDQDAFRNTYREFNERPCEFERGVLTNQCRCRHAERFCIAEREGVHCTSAPTRDHCVALLDLLRQHARFALGARSVDTRLPFGDAMRIQIGGLHGLRDLLDSEASAAGGEPPEVAAIVAGLLEQFGQLDQVPFDRVIPAIASYRGREKRRR